MQIDRPWEHRSNGEKCPAISRRLLVLDPTARRRKLGYAITARRWLQPAQLFPVAVQRSGATAMMRSARRGCCAYCFDLRKVDSRNLTAPPDERRYLLRR
jgi:hypothetical protein